MDGWMYDEDMSCGELLTFFYYYFILSAETPRIPIWV